MYASVALMTIISFVLVEYVNAQDSSSFTDLNITTPQYIAKSGYPVETHHVATDDGYILELHRIPYGLKSPASPGKPVVFLQHGTYSSSFYWVILGVEKALAFVLADAGYDVWMGNSRGNTYSRSHVTRDPSTAAFWGYSWHERGVLDLPAMIDKALAEAKQASLYYIGYSKGTTMFFVLASERPEYNAKVRLAISLASSTFKTKVDFPPDKMGAHSARLIELLSMRVGSYEYSPSTALLAVLRLSLCDRITVAPHLCEELFFSAAGYGTTHVNKTLMAVFISHVSPGLSQKEIAHTRQLVASKRFCQYDYGVHSNVLVYGVATPPDYVLANVVAKVALVVGEGDIHSSQQDVNILKSHLSNVVEEYHVTEPTFNHLDYVLGNDAKLLVYDQVLRMMQTYGDN